MNLNVSGRLIWTKRFCHGTGRDSETVDKENSQRATRENVEMMEEDGPLSSSEAQRAPALAPEEGLSTPVAGPETLFRPTSGMPGLTPSGEHATALQVDKD